MFAVEKIGNNIRLEFSSDECPDPLLGQILAKARIEESLSQSKLTNEDALNLAEEMKSGWWSKNKTRFVKGTD